MTPLFEKLIDSGSWALLGTPNEKLVIAWFATKHPCKPLSYLASNIPAKEITSATGISKEGYAKRSIELILVNEAFKFQYEAVQDKLYALSTNVQTNVRTKTNGETNVKTNVQTCKESERERESSPQTPFIEKGKGKENLTSSLCDEGDDEDVCDSTHNTLSPMQRQSICKHHVTQGNAVVVTPDVAEEANIPRDQVAKKVKIKYETDFTTFVEIYPKRRGLEGAGYFKVRKAWRDCEQRGWTGELILAAVNIARKTDTWKSQNRRFVPMAIHFLAEERMREFLPDELICQALNLSQEVVSHLRGEVSIPIETVNLKNPVAFEEFCALYPKKRGLLDPKEKVEVAKAWQGCEKRGWQPYDIVRSLKEALVSKSWTENDGTYIPTATKFLMEEQMRQFLPIGFKPNGGSTLVERPLTEEEAYWTNLENFA